MVDFGAAAKGSLPSAAEPLSSTAGLMSSLWFDSAVRLLQSRATLPLGILEVAQRLLPFAHFSVARSSLVDQERSPMSGHAGLLDVVGNAPPSSET